MQIKNVVDNYQRFDRRTGIICSVYDYSEISCLRIECNKCQKCKLALKDKIVTVVRGD